MAQRSEVWVVEDVVEYVRLATPRNLFALHREITATRKLRDQAPVSANIEIPGEQRWSDGG